jgi:hypothetical protein
MNLIDKIIKSIKNYELPMPLINPEIFFIKGGATLILITLIINIGWFVLINSIKGIFIIPLLILKIIKK